MFNINLWRDAERQAAHAGSISALVVGSWDIYLAVSVVIFVPPLTVLFIFAWKARDGRTWAR